MPLRERVFRVVRDALPRRPAAYRWLLPKDAIALTFEYVPRRAIGPPDFPPQAPQPAIVAALFFDIEELYWLAAPEHVYRDTPEDLLRDEEWAPRVTAVHFGSPLQILLEIPAYAWAGAATGFVAALSMIFGAPYKAAAKFHDARGDYWRSRLAADAAKQAWIAARQEVHGEDGFRLVNVELPRPTKDE
jgi:hypothetical protein